MMQSRGVVRQDQQEMKQGYRVGLIVATLVIAVPSVLLGFVLGVPGMIHRLTGTGDSGELWLSSLSYLAMLAGSIIALSGLVRRSPNQTSAGLLVLVASWTGAAWDRHRDQFTEWLLLVAVVCLVLSVLIRISNRPHPNSV